MNVKKSNKNLIYIISIVCQKTSS